MPIETSQQETATQKRVLVVDDNEILLRAWGRILEKQGCVFIVTSSPEEALAHLKSTHFDILIADIVMPGMDGFELIQKAQEISRKIRIILTTGYNCDFTRIRLHVETPDIHVLMKPYNDIREIHKFMDRVLHDDDSLDTEDSFKNLDEVKIHLWNL